MKKIIRYALIGLMCIFLESCSYDFIDSHDINIEDSFNINKNDTTQDSTNKSNSNKATGTLSFGVDDINNG